MGTREEEWQKGKEEAFRESLIMVMEIRFGPLPLALIDRVIAVPGGRLEELLRAAATAKSIQAIGLE